MSDSASKDPLHGVTLQMMVERLEQRFGWEGLARKIRIKCFSNDPSVASSLAFLRRTPWARDKVERLYLWAFHKIRRPPAERQGETPAGTPPPGGKPSSGSPRRPRTDRPE